jgi:hypothetical protein
MVSKENKRSAKKPAKQGVAEDAPEPIKIISYSDHYQEKGIFQRLTDRLRLITERVNGFAPVVPTALRC